MLAEELIALTQKVMFERCELQHLELKKAAGGTPKKLYDTLSSFSNQQNGGIILFGIDQDHDYELVGVYDPQDVQVKVTEQANQMEPVVRPFFTVAELDGKMIVSAEISECDIFDKPCFYRGAGRLRGSYIRVGDADIPMTEYEVYNCEAFKRKIRDELREAPEGLSSKLSDDAVKLYLAKARIEKINFAKLTDDETLTLSGLYKDGKLTLAGLLLFGLYPQAAFSGFCITAVTVPGYRMGALADDGARFSDNKRMEGAIPEILEAAMEFVRRNVKSRTILDNNGKRADKTEYPLKAVREVILNALVHRDYSIHTETAPIRIVFFTDRLEVENPGGLFGRTTLDSLGKTAGDIRNPAIAAALEIIIESENRNSGIPTVRREMEEAGLPEPVFASVRGTFKVTLYNADGAKQPIAKEPFDDEAAALIRYCRTPRTRGELAKFLQMTSISYMMKKFVTPLVDLGRLKLTVPDHPRSRNQKFYSE
ncbi:MAG: putative DNA binding domain-containing protein [Peptococcaceae bacterium]|jgi:ATP-dependent DNA helicase RecG|nr:putative DNA binding domain-containing protein [Peptococcaceae bacterium]